MERPLSPPAPQPQHQQGAMPRHIPDRVASPQQGDATTPSQMSGTIAPQQVFTDWAMI